jgi:hypothetical protein
MILIGTIILPLVSSKDEYVNDDCGCYYYIMNTSEFFKKSIPQDPDYEKPIPIIKGVPDYFNWKDFGGQDWTTPAKDQGYCGSCYIFAAIGIIESVINIREGSASIDADLSEQYVLSCLPNSSWTPGRGCNGGEESWVLQLIMATTPDGNYHNGALLEECFQYRGNDRLPCEDKCPDWEDKLIPITDTLQWYPTGSSEDIEIIKSQIMEKGPLTACMQGTNDFINWMHSHHDPNDYFSYVEGNSINHVIIIVGWKDDPTIGRGGYWICKNSWGTDPGYDGFFNIEYGSLKIDSSLINWVDYDPDSYEWPGEQEPPSKPTITGSTSGNIDVEYEYVFNSVDSLNLDVKYFISWGDGSSEWTDFYPSGEDVKINHSWTDKGTYTISAKAVNTNYLSSQIGLLDISIPKNKTFSEINQLISRLILHFPILEILI